MRRTFINWATMADYKTIDNACVLTMAYFIGFYLTCHKMSYEVIKTGDYVGFKP